MARQSAQAPADGDYAIAVLHADSIRLDLYGGCTPRKSGVPAAGWGVGVLTAEQTMRLSKDLAAAALRATPAKPKSRKKP
ncbi:MAG: hypothetical protein GX856_03240 [Gammaproteobacteria bacterium]|nr:hypothetical protein [Gammaproteobacteria bacterium]